MSLAPVISGDVYLFQVSYFAYFRRKFYVEMEKYFNDGWKLQFQLKMETENGHFYAFFLRQGLK